MLQKLPERYIYMNEWSFFFNLNVQLDMFCKGVNKYTE